MKIRNGFVSNSSSTSFCIYGVSLSEKEVTKLDKFTEFCKQNNINSTDLFYEEDYTIGEFLEQLDVDLGVNYHDEEPYYYGVELSSMKMDETKREFQNRVKAKISESLGVPESSLNFGIFEDSWYDG